MAIGVVEPSDDFLFITWWNATLVSSNSVLAAIAEAELFLVETRLRREGFRAKSFTLHPSKFRKSNATQAIITTNKALVWLKMDYERPEDIIVLEEDYPVIEEGFASYDLEA